LGENEQVWAGKEETTFGRIEEKYRGLAGKHANGGYVVTNIMGGKGDKQ